MHNNLSGQNIITHITGRSSIQEVDAGKLKNIVDKYPYFSAAQYLLVKKLYQQKHASFEKEIQKTALHFSNPLWLHYNLICEDEVLQKSAASLEKQAQKTVDFSVYAENISATEEITIEKSEESKQPVFEEQESLINSSSPEEDVERINIEEITPEQKEDHHTVNNNEIDSETEGEIADEFSPGDNKISSVLQNQRADFEKPVDETTPLIVEPKQYYRVDYFASQGIKLNKQEETENKLDAKVKRFTDWLKQMKKIGQQPADLGTDSASESKVQASAENSNQTGDVLTEAMAEVLVKQGKTDKALEIYEKLSFLNPDKSVYFATRIKELKGT